MGVLTPRRSARWRCLVTLTLAAALLAVPVAAQSGVAAQEYQIKAAFLYAFTRFVTWPGAQPGTPDRPWQLCVVGDDPFGDALDRVLEEAKLDNSYVTIHRFQADEKVGPCHVVFVSGSEAGRLGEVLKKVEAPGVLTVSDTSGFADRGGAVQFRIAQNRVRFEINLDAAERAGLRFSSKVLGIALRVREDDGGPSTK